MDDVFTRIPVRRVPGLFGPSYTTSYSCVMNHNYMETDADLPGIKLRYGSSIDGPLSEELEKTWDFYGKDHQYGAWDVYKKHLNEYDLGSKLLNVPPDRDWSKSIPILTEDPQLRMLVLKENFDLFEL